MIRAKFRLGNGTKLGAEEATAELGNEFFPGAFAAVLGISGKDHAPHDQATRSGVNKPRTAKTGNGIARNLSPRPICHVSSFVQS